jgi:hypothetical protein
MIHPNTSRISALPMAFQLSPIIRCNSPDYENSKILDNNDSTHKNNSTNNMIGERLFYSDNFCISDNTCIEPSTWIGGKKLKILNKNNSFNFFIRR